MDAQMESLMRSNSNFLKIKDKVNVKETLTCFRHQISILANAKIEHLFM